MESGRIWRTTSRSQGFSGTEGTALKSTYGWYALRQRHGLTLGFRAFRAATASAAMATSTLPGSAATGGVPLPQWPMLGPVLELGQSSHRLGISLIPRTASPSGVSGMRITRRCKDVPTRPTLNLTRVPTLTTEAARRWLRPAIRLRMDGYTTPWCRLATNAGLRRTCVRRCMLMARLYRKRPTILHGQG